VSVTVTPFRSGSSVSLQLHTALVAIVATSIGGVLGVATAGWSNGQLPGEKALGAVGSHPLVMPLFVTSDAYATIRNSLNGFWGRWALLPSPTFS
jgi:ABC-type spermidine/putrescine transport system permease subunit II